MELFRRLPITRSPSNWPPFPDEAKQAYPALADRFVVLDEEVLPAFREQDASAKAAQIRYRRFRVAMMVGAALTAIAGALLAALGDAGWPAFAVAVLGLATGSLAGLYRRDQPLARYLESRSRAEQLRSLYFRYLSGVDGQDRREIERRVATIKGTARSGTSDD
ncbi:MAG: DUF4231 domain-containing protein [Actinomycetota bacterium]